MIIVFIIADFDVDTDYNQSINQESRYRKESEIFVGKVLTSCILIITAGIIHIDDGES